MTETLDRIRASLVGLRMPCALEALDHTMRRLERGEIGALEAIDGLLAEEHATRETRRIGVALKTARLTPPKTLESFDFSFQPSLDRNRILALAQLDFVARAEVVHFLGPPGTGKSHLATALGVAAVKAGTERLPRHPGRADRGAWPRRARGPPDREASASSAAAACSSSTRSATCRSRPAAPISSSSSSTPATRRAR